MNKPSSVQIKKIPISIIISCFERTDLIKKIVRNIAERNTDYSSYEIILCDSNSCIANCDIPNFFKKIFPLLDISIEHTVNNLAAKRNLGRLLSKYDYLLFLDDDCVPTPKLLEEYRSDFNLSNGNDIFCGEVHYEVSSKSEHRFMTWRRNMEDRAYARGPLLDFRNIVVMNMAMHSSVYDAVGGFSETFTGYGMEDQEFGWRAHHCNVAIRRSAASIVHCDSVESFVQFCKKMYFNGRDGSNNLRVNFPEIHKKIEIYKIIDPDYNFSNRNISVLFYLIRIFLFPPFLGRAIFRAYDKSSIVRYLFPDVLFRYLALYSFIRGAKSRTKLLQKTENWYEDFSL